MLTTYPVAGAEFDFPFYPPEGDYDGYITFTVATPRDILNEVTLAYPGVAIKELGYFCFGNDLTGSGDPAFIPGKQGDNPPIYMVYHDVSDQAEEIEKAGMVKIADSLAQLFLKARFSNTGNVETL